MRPICVVVCLSVCAALMAQAPARRAAPPKAAAPKAVPPAPAPPAAVDPAKLEGTIASIAIQGNVNEPTPAILAVTGLAAGMKGSKEVFDAVRDKLIASGYFDNVQYRFQQSPDRTIAVSFTVSEVQSMYPIDQEGLPITVKEMEAVLRAKSPLFVGLWPAQQNMVQEARVELEKYLASKNRAMELAPKIVEPVPGRFEIQFIPARGLPAIAVVTFEGSKVLDATDLRTAMAVPAFGQPYSEGRVRGLLDANIRPLFEKAGYMRVRFTDISVKTAEEVQGLDVKVGVEDGPQFKLGALTVTGVADSKSILRLAKLPQMEVVNYGEFEKARERVVEGLRGQGYFDAASFVDRKINDGNLTVDVTLNVTPGPLFTFGRLTVLGLTLDGEAAIKKIWSLKIGEAYPIKYHEFFLSSVKEQGLFDGLGGTSASLAINPTTHVVDVTLKFDKADPAPKRRPDF